MSKLAFLFPGQGSQTVGMLGELSQQFPSIEAIFQEASDVLGYDLWSLTQQGPEAELNQTERTQPALLASSVALWRVWQSKSDVQPAFMAGHSLGEYSALVCAEALHYPDAIKLVALRGQLMQQAVQAGEGAMAAIVGLDNAVIEQICQQAAAGQVLAPANYNAIGQTVISGAAAAVERAIQLASAAGAKMAKQIPVSVPSHCMLMKPAAEKLAAYLQTVTIKAPALPIVTNADVACYSDPEQIRSALVRQLYSPVRWVESMQYLIKMGVQQAIECGPGKVLAGLNKRIDANLVTTSIGTASAFQQALDASCHPERSEGSPREAIS